MESLDPEAYFDGLLNFSDDEGDKISRDISLRSNELSNSFGSGRPFHFDDIGKEEEELEWISNKDSFPAVESLADILSDHPGSGVAALKLHSPVSVLEGEGSGSSSSNDSNNTNTTSTTTLTSCFGGLKPPRRARSKRRCRRRRGSYFDLTGKQQCLSVKHCGDRYIDTVKAEKAKEKAAATKKKTMKSSTTMMMMTTTITGRKCQHCGAEKTPQWRAGPYGPKTLCNACGVRYKSGRLVPEYRPASSPSFSSELHSNSHRKIIEMRKVKNMVGMVLNNPAESG